MNNLTSFIFALKDLLIFSLKKLIKTNITEKYCIKI